MISKTTTINAYVVRIEQIIGYYQIWMPQGFPEPKIKLKIVQNVNGDYTCYSNITLLNHLTDEPDWLSFTSRTIELAIEGYMLELLSQFDSYTDKNATRYQWSDPQDF